MLTAKGFEIEPEEMAAKWNILAVIAKPFSPRELLRRVKAILEPACRQRVRSDGAGSCGHDSAADIEDSFCLRSRSQAL